MTLPTRKTDGFSTVTVIEMTLPGFEPGFQDPQSYVLSMLDYRVVDRRKSMTFKNLVL